MRQAFTLEYWLDDGWYVGRLKEKPGVLSQGATFVELEENIRDAFRMMNPELSENEGVILKMLRRGSGSGRKYDELGYKAKRLEDYGFSLLGIKEWRAQETAAGRPSGLDDFYRTHGICAACKCSGIQMTGWDELDQVPLWTICPTCGGTGRLG